jgi:hypothetical protein
MVTPITGGCEISDCFVAIVTLQRIHTKTEMPVMGGMLGVLDTQKENLFSNAGLPEWSKGPAL